MSSVFKFIMADTQQMLYTNQRIFMIIVSFAVNILLIFLLNTSNEKIYIIKFLTIIFILFSIVKNYFIFNNYIAIYHGYKSSLILFFTFVIIIYALNFYHNNIIQIVPFLFAINVFMIGLSLVLTFNKINPGNLYAANSGIMFDFKQIYIMDELLMLNILLIDNKKQFKKSAFQAVYICFTIFFIFTMLQGLILRGNTLYSISPLQAIAQISYNLTIKRYDYIFTSLWTFNYFSSIFISISAYRALKQSMKISNNTDILLIVPCVFLMAQIDYYVVLIVQLAVIAIYLLGNKKVSMYEKI